ncbi:MAG: GTPase HflX [Pseudomonadota bacterium]
MPATRAVVLHPDIAGQRNQRDADAALSEAMALAAALPGLDLAGGDVVRISRAQPGMLFGAGKIQSLKARFEAEDIALVFIDGPVTPVQQRNLERAWGLKILDRTGLILEIFADRARTREGVMQVELAALSYQRTRLVRAWTHLERQRGGLGFVGGPGETQIEADRRAIDDQVARLKRQLQKVVKTRGLHRAARAKVPYPIVALVGYTNAGKSTLFNRLTGAGVVAEDMLFATLDPTMRGVTLPGGTEIILSDTVGFISDLPTQLVAAFRATLEEVRAADLILHVRDISHPDTETQAEDVYAILAELGIAEEVPRIEVWNKADRLDAEERLVTETLAARRRDILAISAVTGDGIIDLTDAISARLDGARSEASLDLPFSEGRARAWLHGEGIVDKEAEGETGWQVTVKWTPRQRRKFGEMYRAAE